MKKGEEVTLMDELNKRGIGKDQLYAEEVKGRDITEEADVKKPRCAVVNTGNEVSALMIEELKARGLEVVTEIKEKMDLDFNNVQRWIDKEAKKNNEYVAIFLPLDNDDLNKENGLLWNNLIKLNRNVSIPVRAWFADHEKAEINRRLSRSKEQDKVSKI